MRITPGEMNANLLDYLAQTQEAVQQSQQRISSGLKVQAPSDDPQNAARLLQFDSQLSADVQYQKNISAAAQSLNASLAGMGQLEQQLSQAKSLMVEASSTASPTKNSALVVQMDAILNNALGTANTMNGSQAVFAGTATGAAPFTATLGPDAEGVQRVQAVAYNGNAGALSYEISPGSSVVGTISGQELFAPGAGGVFETLIAARQAIDSGASLSSLQDTMDSLLGKVQQLQARLGAAVSSLGQSANANQAEQLNLKSERSAIQDTDIAAESIAMTQKQTSYQATLQVIAKIGKVSLMDYL